MDARVINTDHADLIHDVSYDFYGRRIATCSSDLQIKIFDYNESSDSWVENDSWKAADAAILKIVWAHPEHGQVIALASMDRTVRVFEEQEHEAKGSGKRWAEKARLAESRGAVHDIRFAPEHLGLRIASISADAQLRIYEALEPNNLSHWTLMDEVAVMSPAPSRESEAAFCLTWCPSRWAGQRLAIGAMDTVKIWRTDRNNRWKAEETLEGHKDLVRDISWGRSMGKSYQLIATACKDGNVRVFKLTEAPDPADTDEEGSMGYVVELLACFDDHKAPVWRVSFNITGTVLSSSGDDGNIRLWKSSYAHKFQCMAVISMEQRDADQDMDG